MTPTETGQNGPPATMNSSVSSENMGSVRNANERPSSSDEGSRPGSEVGGGARFPNGFATDGGRGRGDAHPALDDGGFPGGAVGRGGRNRGRGGGTRPAESRLGSRIRVETTRAGRLVVQLCEGGKWWYLGDEAAAEEVLLDE